MKTKQLDKLNVYLGRWRGADAFINTYIDENERLIIGFKRPDNPLEFVGVCFLNCVYVSGPTRWSNCDVQCHNYPEASGEIGIEIRDSENGLLVRCEGPVVVGDGELIFERI